MLASAILFLSLGIPCMVLGVYFRLDAGKAREEVTKGKKKTRAKKKQKGDKDQPGKERGTGGGLSLILGGLVCTVVGAAFLASWFNR